MRRPVGVSWVRWSLVSLKIIVTLCKTAGSLASQVSRHLPPSVTRSSHYNMTRRYNPTLPLPTVMNPSAVTLQTTKKRSQAKFVKLKTFLNLQKSSRCPRGRVNVNCLD